MFFWVKASGECEIMTRHLLTCAKGIQRYLFNGQASYSQGPIDSKASHIVIYKDNIRKPIQVK